MSKARQLADKELEDAQMTRARDLAKFNLDGQAVTINESSADLDFRVESNGNANMLFVDGGNNHVNIGSSTDANGVLNVSDGTSFSTGITVENTGDTHGSVIDFLNNSESPADNDYIGGLVFKETNSAGGTHMFAKIFGMATDITDGTEDGAITFDVSAGGANTAECMRIKAGGDIQIGEGDIFFSTAGKGIVLGATSNTDANTLHDYEEGTWTPRVTGSTGGVVTPTSDNGGTYVKVGDMVSLHFSVHWDAVTTSVSGQRRFSGLPFTSADITGNQTGNFCGPHYNGMLQSGHLNFMSIAKNENFISILSVNSDGTNNASGHNYDHSGMSMPTAGNMTSLTLVYRAAQILKKEGKTNGKW